MTPLFCLLHLRLLTSQLAQSRCPGGSKEQTAYREQDQHRTHCSPHDLAPVLVQEKGPGQSNLDFLESPGLLVSAVRHPESSFTGFSTSVHFNKAQGSVPKCEISSVDLLLNATAVFNCT